MGYRLKDTLAFCIVGDRTIFLDVEADRYFGLKPQWDATFQAIVRGDGACDPAHVSALIETQLLVEVPEVTSVPRPVSIARATRELPRRATGQNYLISLQCVAAQIETALRLRFRPFARILAKFEQDAPQGVDTVEGDIEQRWMPISVAFARSRRLRLRSAHCLTSSLAFLRVAQARGLCATLVIGVSGAPFGAHCWVQVEDYVLNDRLENILAFEPILAVQC